MQFAFFVLCLVALCSSAAVPDAVAPKLTAQVEQEESIEQVEDAGNTGNDDLNTAETGIILPVPIGVVPVGIGYGGYYGGGKSKFEPMRINAHLTRMNTIQIASEICPLFVRYLASSIS